MKRLALRREHIPFLATLFVLILLYTAAALRYEGFATPRVFANFLDDNAFLGIVAVGMTFVIISGGIDLSVGALVGAVTICAAALIQKSGLHPALAFGLMLAAGTGFGALQGVVIHKFRIQPFLATLASLFLFRGIGLWISEESIQVDHPFLQSLDSIRVPIADRAFLSFRALLFLAVLAAASVVLARTRFGRTVYAMGGDEASAALMGLKTGRTKIGIYAVCGFCAALGGIALLLYTSAGNAINGSGLELDAIAAVVIGGAMLTGGSGSPLGTLLGVLIAAVIQSAIIFDGSLSSWWGRIVTGALLLAFLLLQKALRRGQPAQ